MKYLFSLLICLSAFHATGQGGEYWYQVVLDSGFPISNIEIYIPELGHTEWQVMPSVGVNSHGYVVTSLRDLDLTGIPTPPFTYIRFNKDDTLVFKSDNLPQWADGLRYSLAADLSLVHGGLFFRSVSRVYNADWTNLVVVGEDVILSPVLSPFASDGGITVPVSMQSSTLVRSAIWEVYNREIHRMWVLVFPMFGLGLIWFIHKRTRHIAKG